MSAELVWPTGVSPRLKLCNISLVQLCDCLTCCCSLSQRANSERLQSRDGVPESFLLPVEVLISSQPPSPQLQFTLTLGGFPAGRASLLLKPAWQTWKQIPVEVSSWKHWFFVNLMHPLSNLDLIISLPIWLCISYKQSFCSNGFSFVAGIANLLICIFNFNLLPLIEVHRVYFRIISGCVPLDCWVDRLVLTFLTTGFRHL